ncbi:CD48 antigen-like isoform X2 [Hemibagrus wyckioides]|uniref:CD48 antigen-like isoform X2 n=1 Tax=Hemibagrus wyckioides TaxID=337641 RepID=UPI00266BB771|nr:CD48 antigen-like isoform X2 [Hemibagrus wyckioides]
MDDTPIPGLEEDGTLPPCPAEGVSPPTLPGQCRHCPFEDSNEDGFPFESGSSQVCSDVFKLVNSSVKLVMQKKVEKFYDIGWIFNTENNIVRYNGNPPSKVFGSYKDKVEFNEETYSLTLKNVQKNDSGIYEAKAIDEQTVTVATYQLYVLDLVEKPVLSDSLQQSNDTCNVTLTCEAQKLSVTSHCYNNNCDLRKKKTSGDMFLSLSLHVSNSFIICNHSNPLSWKNTIMEMKHVKQLCPDKGISTIIIIIFFIIICCQRKRRTKVNCQNKKNDASSDVFNMVYEEIEPMNKGGNKAQSENHAAADSVYCTVGMAAQACSKDASTVSTANPGSKNQRAERNCESVDQTIFVTVNKARKPVYKA